MHRLIRLFILSVPLLLLSACSFSLAADITPPPGSEQSSLAESSSGQAQQIQSGPLYPIVPPDPANGGLIYAENCAPCHGISGLGDGPDSVEVPFPVAPIGSADFARLYPPAEWYSIVTLGNIERFMPPFRSLSDRERWDVIAFVLTLSAPSDSVALGRTVYEENCSRCHGENGQGDGPDAATLSAVPRSFNDQEYMAGRPAVTLFESITLGIAPDMPAFQDQLSEIERWAVTDYLRSLTFAATSAPYPYPAPEVTPPPESYPAPEAYPAPSTTGTAVSPGEEITATTSTPTGLGTVLVQLTTAAPSESSLGGGVLDNLEVTLYGFDEMQIAFSQTLSVGVNGLYTFSEIEMPPERVFLAGVNFDGATYGSDIAMADPANPEVLLQIMVYESTTDTSLLTIDRVHILLDFIDAENVQVVEVFIISNPSSSAIVAAEENGPVVTFPLPEGYMNLEFQDGVLGERYLEVPGGFADTMSVSPGMSDYQVVFAFQMSYDRKLEFAQQLGLPTSAVVVMLPDNGVRFSSSQLQDSGTRDFQGTQFRMYEGGSLNASSQLSFTLSGRPRQSGSVLVGPTSTQSLAIGLGVFGLALVLAGLWLYRRNQQKPVGIVQEMAADSAEMAESAGVIEEAPLSEVLPADDAETLMDAIIALDEQYQAGDLPEEAYLERRGELKEKLQQALEK